jgi:hypothetical protein
MADAVIFRACGDDSQSFSYVHVQIPTIEELQDRGVYAIQASTFFRFVSVL